MTCQTETVLAALLYAVQFVYDQTPAPSPRARGCCLVPLDDTLGNKQTSAAKQTADKQARRATIHCSPHAG